MLEILSTGRVCVNLVIENALLPLSQYLNVLVRLCAAVVLGGLIGLERGGSKHDAGLRTHIIVCLGSATVMLTSELVLANGMSSGDVFRLGAQVISGIGFLGVGSIIVTRQHVRGLTTAAGLWTTACVGLTIGAGLLDVAVTVVLLMMFTMFVLRPLTERIHSTGISFELHIDADKDKVQEIVDKLISMGYDISSVKRHHNEYVVLVLVSHRADKNELFSELIKIDCVTGISDV